MKTAIWYLLTGIIVGVFATIGLMLLNDSMDRAYYRQFGPETQSVKGKLNYVEYKTVVHFEEGCALLMRQPFPVRAKHGQYIEITNKDGRTEMCLLVRSK